jgi:hypothetical protein
MGLRYENLDGDTRQYMVEEVDMDTKQDELYLSSFLSQAGQGDWSLILRDAAVSGSDDTLAGELATRGRLNTFYMKRKPKGGSTQARVPITASSTMAEGEFNRYYVRGLCRRAIDEGIPRLEVYRAKEVMEPRPDSFHKIGRLMEPSVVLIDARTRKGVDTALGMPHGPNSGLTLRIPQGQSRM